VYYVIPTSPCLYSVESGYVRYDDMWRVVQTRPSDEDQDDDLRKAFIFFDEDGTGELDINELKAMLTVKGDVLTDAEVEDILREADLDNNGKINYEGILRSLLFLFQIHCP